MKAKVYNKNLEVAEEIDLNAAIYEVEPQVELVQQAVRVQRANARSPIANTKTRGQVSGGGKKPWKQKGTGNARAGSIRSPLWRHGGITFGPSAERNYALKMNKKQWRKALYMTLSDKVASNQLLIFSEMIEFETPKTKEMRGFLDGIKQKIADGSKKFLFVLPKSDEKLSKSVRNLKGTKVIQANSLNILDLLNYDTVVLPKQSLEIIEKTYLK
jgi:large subunit ribosomal protein L4